MKVASDLLNWQRLPAVLPVVAVPAVPAVLRVRCEILASRLRLRSEICLLSGVCSVFGLKSSGQGSGFGVKHCVVRLAQ